MREARKLNEESNLLEVIHVAYQFQTSDFVHKSRARFWNNRLMKLVECALPRASQGAAISVKACLLRLAVF